jgi:hypothetical protein
VGPFTTNNTKPIMPALIVFGTPKGAKAPHAAWFRAAYAARVVTAARRQALTTVAVESNETRAMAATLKEGQLNAGGQLVMPCVSQDMLSQLRRLVQQQPPGSSGASPAGATTAGVQVPIAVWDTLKPTDVVLAAHLENGVPDGWYEAIIMKNQGGTFTLRWADYPRDPLVRVQRQHIALMYPG